MSRVYVEGGYVYRSGESIAAIALCVVMSAVFLFVSTRPFLDGAWKLLPIAMSLLMFGMMCRLMWRVFRDDVEWCTITDDGVQIDGVLRPWADVRALYATRSSGDRVQLQMSCRRDFFIVSLLVRPHLTGDAYERLVDELKESVGRRYPDLQLGGYDDN